MSRTLLATIAGLLMILVLVAGYTLLMPAEHLEQQASVPIGGPFALIGENGEQVTEADFAGRYMLLYFGYTYCPDICPTGLATMTAAFEQLPAAIQAKVAPVFITVDPERDTVPVVAEYTDLFHPELLGLSGSVEAIDAAKATFRVYAEKAGDDPVNYLVDHATFTYLIGPDGMYVTHFNHGETPENMAAIITEKTS